MEKKQKFIKSGITVILSVLFSFLVVFSVASGVSYIRKDALMVEGDATIEKTATIKQGATIWGLAVINQTNQDLGILTQGRVGIGSKFFGQNAPLPSYILDVDGDINVTGKFLKNGVEFLGGSQWTDVATRLISYNGNIRVEGGNILSGPQGPDDKRVKLNMTVAQRFASCQWAGAPGSLEAVPECVDPPGPIIIPSCGPGQFGGDTQTVDTGIACSSFTTEVACKGKVKFRSYRSCLGIQLE